MGEVKIDRVTVIVLDSVGVGELPDADKFGDTGANTIAHTADAASGLKLPNMEILGLGNLTNISGVKPMRHTSGAYGKAAELSKGKDTSAGHWEIAGVVTKTAFPTYSKGFPKKLVEELEKRTGRMVMGNCPASGTAIIEELGEEQIKTGAWIVYTSADPVLQIAAHEEVIPLDELYKACEIALEICKELAPVVRVIARPYIGEKQSGFVRTENRKDYSVEPPEETVLDKLKLAGLDVVGIGKISDIFSGRGITRDMGHNMNNKDGILKSISALKENTKGLIFTNLVDFDMNYGHRRDPKGYKEALEEFDYYIPEILDNMGEEEILIITADHGCDPTYKGTDHTREYVPVLVCGKRVKPVNIGTRKTFADIAATLEELLLGTKRCGSFVKEILD